MPIDGLVSGLDTNSIVNQLMDVERRPRLQLQARRDGIQAGLDAIKAIETKLAALSTAAGAVQRSSGWTLRTATSSSPAARVSASSGAALGSLSFTVDALAAAHGIATAVDVGSTAAVVASGGSITIHKTDGDHVVAVGGGTLAEVAASINGAGLGLRAATVNTGTGFRLQVSSITTGLSSAFSITSGLDGGGGTVVTTQAADARITLGTGPGAFSVTSSSNTFAAITPGVSITVGALAADPITVDVGIDVATIGDKVKGLVDSVNAALSEVATKTAYDPTTKKSAALTGDAAARKVAQALTRAVTDAVAQSSLHSAGLAGVALDQKGKLTFDRAKFDAAFQADPGAVQRLFVQGATTTGSVEFVSALDRTTAGVGQVEVTTAATAATSSGLAEPWPLASPPTVRVRIGDTEVAVAIGPADTAADARAALQSAIDGAQLALDVTQAGGGLAITHRNLGSASGFEVAWDGATWTQQQGGDVAGTIDGLSGQGAAQMLSLAPGAASPLAGLTVRINGAATGNVGSVDYEPGLAQRIAQAIYQATDATSGYLSSAEGTRSANVKSLDSTLAAYDLRLTAREKQLRKQYADLEVALGKLRNQSNWLAGQLSVTNANNNNGR